MQYAPVIIPTLNRKDHLSRCIESLANNAGAQNTEVYISVDYPPSDKYVKGYQEVKEYLDAFDISRFKKLHIIYQEKNLGPKANCDFLEQVARKAADRYIFTEDDNEFSANFLEYINKGLELYENNPDVIAICGFKDTDWEYDNNEIAYVKLLPAYGYGTWFKKSDKLKKHGVELLLDKKTLSLKNMVSLAKKNRALFEMLICDVWCTNKGLFWEKGELYWCDSMKSIYMHLTDAVCVVPQLPKSRTWGNDGSGVNMGVTDINPEIKWPLDQRKHFDYPENTNISFNEQNYVHGSNYLKCVDSFVRFVLSIVLYSVLKICRCERKYFKNR